MPTKKPLIGAAIVGQSGGPSSVINASAYGVIKTALCEDMPLMQAENAVTAVTAEDYELKLDDDSTLKVSPNQIFNSNKFQDAQITSAEILPQDDSADGQRVTVRFVIEATAKNTVGSFVVGTQEVRIGRDYIVKTVDIEMLGTVSAMEKLHG